MKYGQGHMQILWAALSKRLWEAMEAWKWIGKSVASQGHRTGRGNAQ